MPIFKEKDCNFYFPMNDDIKMRLKKKIEDHERILSLMSEKMLELNQYDEIILNIRNFKQREIIFEKMRSMKMWRDDVVISIQRYKEYENQTEIYHGCIDEIFEHTEYSRADYKLEKFMIIFEQIVDRCKNNNRYIVCK